MIGNLTRDPELRYTPQGTAVCSFGIATNRDWMTDSGEKKEDVEFHRIVAWAKLAELCAQLLFKGRKVYVSGRLQTRQWTGQDGVARSTTEIVIDNMMVLDSRNKGEEGASEFGGGGDFVPSSYGNQASNMDTDYSDEFLAEDSKEAAPAKSSKPKKKSDDEMPF